jgi:hypothetical protein
MKLDDKSAFLHGFFVDGAVVGQGHIRNLTAFAAMKVVVVVYTPVVTQSLFVCLHTVNLAFLDEYLQVPINRPEAHPFRL